MRISASQIISWVEKNSRKAQEFIPFLVGQLCHSCTNTSRINFPSGDSISKPGFDGFVSSEGDAWVPKGQSAWEIGTNKEVTSKANSDFQKRTSELSDEFRARTTYIFVTPRRWNKKTDWAADMQRGGHGWLDIRVYDVDDLEQWLEQRPTVKVKFLEVLNESSQYVLSLNEYWRRWAASCTPPITANSFLAGRVEPAKSFREKIKSAISSTREIISIAADSAEESSVFAAATLLADEELSRKCLVVTRQEGWRFIDTITQDIIAIAAYEYSAADFPVKENITIVTPIAVSTLSQTQTNVVTIDRPEIYEYRQALVTIGLTEADARRAALNTGRSWVVFRRHNPVDGRIIQPSWADKAEAKILPILCLFGAWNSHKFGDEWYYDDTGIVSSVTGLPYSDIEQHLNYLLSCDDAPIIFLNNVWKAKSPLELFFLFGDKVSTEQLDRFFETAEKILSEADPQFELDQDKRWMAHSYGKRRHQSREIINALCDSLIKLAVLGPELPRLNQLSIEARIRRLIKNLLENAQPIRWVSLHSVLPALAEAAPDIFLTSVEKSLRHPEQPVAELIRQSHSGGLGGNCYHAGLLWALETLAWNPSYLLMVTKILAQLALVKTESKWGNTPQRSLFNIFCLWFPQTAASATERIEVLKATANEFPGVIVSLLHQLVLGTLQSVEQTPKQKWRNDDTRANQQLSRQKVHETQKCFWNYLLELSLNDTSYSIKLLSGVNFLYDEEKNDTVIDLIKSIKHKFSSSEQAKIAQIIRNKISSCEFFLKREQHRQNEIERTIEKFNNLLGFFLIDDTLLKYKWLFDSWQIPIKGIDQFDHKKINIEAFKMREEALHEVLIDSRTSLLDQLVQECQEPGTIGALIAYKWDEFSLEDWLVMQIPKAEINNQVSKLLHGFFRHRNRETVGKILQLFIDRGSAENWDNTTYASMFLTAPQLSEAWNMLDTCSQEVQDEYWKRISLDYFHEWESRLDYFITRMVRAGRPRTAINALLLVIEKIPAQTLFELMKTSLFMDFDDVPLQLQSYDWEKMLHLFEEAQEVDRNELLSFEFNIIPIIQFDCKQAARTLFERYSSDPNFFLWIIDAAYKHDASTRSEALPNYPEHIRSQSFSVIYSCEKLPGQDQSGNVDVEMFKAFIEAVRTGSREMAKTDVCNIALGYMLVHAPEHIDGSWPPPYVCDVLEPVEQDVLRDQFAIETRNLRGAHTRAYAEGGNQERDLAKRYRAYQEALRTRYPNVSMLMGELAASYEHDGRQEDQEAGLRLEGF